MADYARCAWWSIDHDRAYEHVQRWRRRRSFSFLSFCFLHLVVVASSLLALSSGSLLLSERMTVLVSFSRQSHTGVLQLLEPFFTGSRSEEEGAEAHGPEDRPSRRRVVLLSFFSPGTACNSSWRPSPSHAKPCWLVAAIHPESTTNWPETKAIEHAPPFTGHEQGGRDFDFGNVSSPRPLIWLPSCFAKQQSGHSSVIVWFCFSRKSPQKMKKITSSSKQETENKKINEPSWSPFDCVTSRVTQQHSRRYFQLDLTMSCRESMLQLQLQFPATRGTLASVPAICNHERDVKTKAREI